MAEPEDLVLLHLRALRGEMHKMSETIHTLRTEMIEVRQRLAGLSRLQDHDHDEIAKLGLRLDRIESRLGLID